MTQNGPGQSRLTHAKVPYQQAEIDYLPDFFRIQKGEGDGRREERRERGREKYGKRESERETERQREGAENFSHHKEREVLLL